MNVNHHKSILYIASLLLRSGLFVIWCCECCLVFFFSFSLFCLTFSCYLHPHNCVISFGIFGVDSDIQECLLLDFVFDGLFFRPSISTSDAFRYHNFNIIKDFLLNKMPKIGLFLDKFRANITESNMLLSMPFQIAHYRFNDLLFVQDRFYDEVSDCDDKVRSIYLMIIEWVWFGCKPLNSHSFMLICYKVWRDFCSKFKFQRAAI